MRLVEMLDQKVRATEQCGLCYLTGKHSLLLDLGNQACYAMEAKRDGVGGELWNMDSKDSL